MMLNGLQYLGYIFERVQKLVKSRGFLRILNIMRKKNFFSVSTNYSHILFEFELKINS